VTLKAPFPYFGGKRRAAPLIWEALGDPGGYIEPFAGSAAALLARPAVSGLRVETLNDASGQIQNVWRSIKYSPRATALAADWIVTRYDDPAPDGCLPLDCSLREAIGAAASGDSIVTEESIWVP
jgi:site-specific DNA-adenine methylase